MVNSKINPLGLKNKLIFSLIHFLSSHFSRLLNYFSRCEQVLLCQWYFVILFIEKAIKNEEKVYRKQIKKKRKKHENAVVGDIDVSVRKEKLKEQKNNRKTNMTMREGPPPLSRPDLKGL